MFPKETLRKMFILLPIPERRGLTGESQLSRWSGEGGLKRGKEITSDDSAKERTSRVSSLAKGAAKHGKSPIRWPAGR